MSSIINHLGRFAKDLEPIALSSTNALKNFVAPAATLIAPKVSAIYTRFIANTMGGTICSTLGSIALKAWNFNVCNIHLLQVAVGLYVLSVVTDALSNLSDRISNKENAEQGPWMVTAENYYEKATSALKEAAIPTAKYTVALVLGAAASSHLINQFTK